MASSLHSNVLPLISHPANPKPAINVPSSSSTIRSGPRDKRGPLIRGRILSIEAIQAIQSLKRVHHKSTDPSQYRHHLSNTAARLIKSDLIASINELLRQNRCHLAADLFSAARSEAWYRTDLGMYANLVEAMARNGLRSEMEGLVSDLEKEGMGCDGKGLVRLVKTVVAGGSVESTMKIYEMIREGGWGGGPNVLKVLGSGLKRLGKSELADEVGKEYHRLCKPNWRKLDF